MSWEGAGVRSWVAIFSGVGQLTRCWALHTAHAVWDWTDRLQGSHSSFFCNPACPPTPHAQVQTNGRKTPIAAVQDTLKDLEGEVQDIRQQFMNAVGAEWGQGLVGTDSLGAHLSLVPHLGRGLLGTACGTEMFMRRRGWASHPFAKQCPPFITCVCSPAPRSCLQVQRYDGGGAGGGPGMY